MITVFNTTKMINGVFIANLDQADCWGEKYPVYFTHDKDTFIESYSNIQRTYRTYANVKHKLIENNVIEDEIVYMSFTSLLNHNYSDVKIKCKKLIIQDTLFLTFVLFGIPYDHKIPHYPEYVKKRISEFEYEELIFLMPKHDEEMFKEIFPDFPYKIDYKKININVLKTIKFKNNGRTVSRTNHEADISFEYLKDIEYSSKVKWFDYSAFYYHPREHLFNLEQHNRAIYEFLLLGKTVYMDEDVFHNTQPMSSILKYYGVSHDKETNTLVADLEDLSKRVDIKQQMWLVE